MKLRRNLQMRAALLLGVNCGFGQSDIDSLHEGHLDLVNGWATFPRPKTRIDRQSALWPETILALRDVLAVRRKPKSVNDEGLGCRRRGCKVVGRSGGVHSGGRLFSGFFAGAMAAPLVSGFAALVTGVSFASGAGGQTGVAVHVLTRRAGGRAAAMCRSGSSRTSRRPRSSSNSVCSPVVYAFTMQVT